MYYSIIMVSKHDEFSRYFAIYHSLSQAKRMATLIAKDKYYARVNVICQHGQLAHTACYKLRDENGNMSEWLHD